MSSKVLSIAIIAAVALLMSSATYLYATRGPAMLLDISAAASQLICF